MQAGASASLTPLQVLPITTPSSPSNTILPLKDRGKRMVSPPARNELLVLTRYSGSLGIAAFSFAASAWKLFQTASILVGWVGVSSLTADNASVCDVATG